MPLCLQCHTLEISHIIKQDEVNTLCRVYNVPYGSDVHIAKPNIAGINAISISRKPVMRDGILVRHTYTMTLQFNVGRLLKRSNVAMTDLKKNDAKTMIDRLDRILSQKLHLSAQNSNSADWMLGRLDCGIDLHMGIDEPRVLRAYMRLLHKGFTMNCRCGYTPYKGYDRPEVKSESVTLDNMARTFSYNIYYKLLEWLKKNPSAPQTETAEIWDVIRIEKQLKGSRGLKQLTPDKKRLSALLDESRTFALMGKIVAEVKELFGSGFHVTYDEAIRIIRGSPYGEGEKVRLQVLYASVDTFGYLGTAERLVKQYGWDEASCRKMMDECRKKIEALGISIAGLSLEDVEMTGQEKLESIGDILQKQWDAGSVKKSKGTFGGIRYDAARGRWRCNFRYHDAAGVTHRTTVAGKKGEPKEAVEMKVLGFIRDNMRANMKATAGNPQGQIRCLELAEDEIQRFKETITRKEMLATLDDCIRQIEGRIQKSVSKEAQTGGIDYAL